MHSHRDGVECGNKSGRGLSFNAWESPFGYWLLGPGEMERRVRGVTYLQQKFQAATESVQLSTGICHRCRQPVALKGMAETAAVGKTVDVRLQRGVGLSLRRPQGSLWTHSPFRSLVILRTAPSLAMSI